MSFAAKCNKCNTTCTAEDDWIGQEAECPECGATIIIEKPEAKLGLSIRKAQPPGSENMQKSAVTLPKDGQIICPNCQHPSNSDAVICIGCGINLKTGKKLSGGGSDSKGAFMARCFGGLKKIILFWRRG
ncbi:MAG: hypothetical protein WCP55_08415 [Lentisphaerota bacterium]